MRVKLFTLRYSATLGGFDDTALTEFTRERELVSFREHFFSVNDVPHLACVMVWQDAVVAYEDVAAAREVPRPPPRKERDRSPSAARSSTESVLESLDERERVLFNTLREWRSAKAHEEGVPPYLIFTNRHLVELVRRRPDSPTAITNDWPARFNSPGAHAARSARASATPPRGATSAPSRPAGPMRWQPAPASRRTSAPTSTGPAPLHGWRRRACARC